MVGVYYFNRTLAFVLSNTLLGELNACKQQRWDQQLYRVVIKMHQKDLQQQRQHLAASKNELHWLQDTDLGSDL